LTKEIGVSSSKRGWECSSRSRTKTEVYKGPWEKKEEGRVLEKKVKPSLQKNTSNRKRERKTNPAREMGIKELLIGLGGRPGGE